ncbi:AsmA family protein [Geomonas sp. RF6]|uniref:AsmA family protein n=1 Tax=Geomonas sp. RF6 TaxID=2897342 RepID=UPI001E44FD83|nr:AsmA family protein [Geomonas sp. RF6]UFS70764.1 AsmA family protein [Geomonas sp. RF6]
MRKGLKITGIVAGVVVALLVLLAAAAKILITPERVKATVVPLAEKKLHRQLKLGEIKVSLFSGILLRDVAVMEKDGKGVFLQAHEAKLAYQFWPLLHKQVIVDEIALDTLKLNVVRMPDGTFNYSDITAKKEAPEQAKPPAKEEINLVVSKVEVKDSEVRFEDRKVPSGPPAVYTVSDLDLSAKDISLQDPFPVEIKGKVFATPLEIKAKIANASNKPSLEGTVKIPQGDLRKLVAALPATLAPKARPFDPSGTVKVDLDVAGPVSAPVQQLLKKGEIALSNVQVTASGQRPTIAGHLKLAGDTVSSQDLNVTLGQNKLNIALNIAHLLAKPLVIGSTVKADTFSLDPFLKKGPAGGPPAGAAEKPEPGPMNLPVQASGTVQIGNTSYKGLPVSGLFLKYRLVSNVFHIEELRGKTAGGSFSDTGRVDLGKKGYGYATRLALRGVQIEQVVKAFAPQQTGKVFGALSLDADITGAGTKTGTLERNLGGGGNFSITGGRMTGTHLLQELSRYLNAPELREIHFTTFGGNFRFQDGKLLLDSSIASKDLQTAPKGTVGLIDKSLNLALPTKIAPNLTSKIARGGTGKYVADEKGWGTLPLKVTGTTTAPKVRLDTSGIGAELAGKAKEKAKEKLEQTLKDKLMKQKPGEEPRPEQEILQKGLRGIFGK